jgi:hypothetical protein
MASYIGRRKFLLSHARQHGGRVAARGARAAAGDAGGRWLCGFCGSRTRICRKPFPSPARSPIRFFAVARELANIFRRGPLQGFILSLAA